MTGLDLAVETPPAGDARGYETLFENLFEGFIVCEAIRGGDGHVVDYRIRYANPVYARRAPPGEAQVGKRMLEMRPGTPSTWFAACERALNGERVHFEFQEARSGRWYDVHMVKMSDDEFAQLYVDLTGRKAVEQRQSDLLRELNHRVKNNLAVVSAILELQARSAPREVKEHLARAVDRVQSIALLHEVLYRGERADQVDLAAYLQELGANLERTLLAPLGVRLAVSCEPVECPVRVAVNLGVIVNELVTNAAKHAYGEAGGQVEVTVAVANDQLHLVVADGGKGFPDDKGRARPGLGFRLVRSLAEGLGGEVAIGPGPGARVQVTVGLAEAVPSPAAQQRLL